MMKDPHVLAAAAEANLAEFMAWQIKYRAVPFAEYARGTATPEDVLRSAALLYPRFVEIEGAVVREEAYQPENWRQWRERGGPFASAAMVNHVHVDYYLNGEGAHQPKLEDTLGELLAFFWQLAADHQFPGAGVKVEYDGDVINVTQPDQLERERKRGPLAKWWNG